MTTRVREATDKNGYHHLEESKTLGQRKNFSSSANLQKPQTGGFWASRGKIFSAWGQKTFMIATQLMGGGGCCKF